MKWLFFAVGNAVNGLKYIVRGRMFLVGLCVSAAVIIGAVLLGFTKGELFAFITCIGLVLGLEAFNSVLERLTNLIDERKRGEIKLVKDMSAGMVLVACVVALAVGILALAWR